MSSYKTKDFEKEENILIIVSTHGDGEPPEQAQKFYDFIKNYNNVSPDLNFSVLALGDSSYPLFCQTGVDISEKLQSLGANKILDITKCDVEFKPTATKWIQDIIAAMSGKGSDIVATKDELKVENKNKYIGTVIESINLNDDRSNKETYHIEIECDEDINYKVGDAFGVMPRITDEHLAELLEMLKLDGDEKIPFNEQEVPIKFLLNHKLNVAKQSNRVKKKFEEEFGIEFLEDAEDLVDILKRMQKNNKEIDGKKILSILEKATPRLYSISSSPVEYSNSCHITVALAKYKNKDGEECFGSGSGYLKRLKVGDKVKFKIQANDNFRLPSEDKDIIMVGAGTGIAPFRAFMQERADQGGSGRNWLFFGEQYQRYDFLYQTEWQEYVESGDLDKISLAFSRDQEEKVYVQNKMLEDGQELFKWLEGGASFYVCGAKDPMSKDVEKALIQILKTYGNMNEDKAIEYLEVLSDEGKYIKDVY
jgi:sulfite reductase (NADPH) flavoprotein alpha-component